ncbi:OSGIN2 family protein [Megaselia abdita]
MKDISIRNIPKDSIYKEFVVIGNGPSGISLSYMLAGNWPYWNQQKIQRHPDEMLRARLNYADGKISLVEQNLEDLAEGIEGRGTNPVSLLLDSLEHPCADLGMELPSMLEYKSNDQKIVDHVVIGKGPPGGTWHKMDPNVRTLSLASWMSLPGYSYGDWENDQMRRRCSEQKFTSGCKECSVIHETYNNEDSHNNNDSEPDALCCKCTSTLKETEEPLKPLITIPPRRNLSLKRQVSKEVQTRALVSRVAKYYEDYVDKMLLDKYFLNNANVTFIAPLHESVAQQGKFPRARWIVAGINEVTSRPFYYVCRNIVLANGVSDLPNRLGIKGEQMNVHWVKHELPELEKTLERIPEKERAKLKPVLIIGAGLSAADAVTICRNSDIPVIHVYRSKTAGLDKSLPENVYPEYHEVHEMMRDSSRKYDYYTPVPEHSLINVSVDCKGVHRVTVKNINTSELQTFEVSYCAILIGSRPNLGFTSGINKSALRNAICITNSYIIAQNDQHNMSPLTRKLSWLKSLCDKCRKFSFCEKNRREILPNPMDCQKKTIEDSGIGLGLDPAKPVDSKTNQIDVDRYSYEVQNIPFKGIYAMGPLVGDNFVRFIPGGALAITASYHKEND